MKSLGIVAVAVFLVTGAWGIDRAAQQQRDIARKHHLEDIEGALFRYARAHGTYPPDEQVSWCGLLSDPNNSEVRNAIEAMLRKDPNHEDPEKPFPADPVYGETDRDYAYWKTSPVSFELVSLLEADTRGARSVPCTNHRYHYRIESTERESSQ